MGATLGKEEENECGIFKDHYERCQELMMDKFLQGKLSNAEQGALNTRCRDQWEDYKLCVTRMMNSKYGRSNDGLRVPKPPPLFAHEVEDISAETKKAEAGAQK